MKFVASLAFLAAIVAANWSLNRWGIVPLGPWMVPAGVYFAGLTFGLRDAVQELGGRAWTVGLIVAGAALSAFIDPAFAVASGCAFLFAEMADFVAYQPLRERHWTSAVVVSNLVGSAVDSVLFLWLAGFGVTVAGVTGMVVGKFLMTAVAIPIVWWARNRRALAA